MEKPLTIEGMHGIIGLSPKPNRFAKDNIAIVHKKIKIGVKDGKQVIL